MEFLRQPLAELASRADKIRKECAGNKLELCSIINAKSGLCNEDCKFCAQSSRHPARISHYSLRGKDEIVKRARNAKKIGARKFGIVTSGNKLSPKELDNIASCVSEIKNKIGITVCASLGALEKPQLKTLKEAGLSRYHHNIETSSRFYPRIVSTHGIDERIRTIEQAKIAGLEVCSGGIIGMGESWQDRIDMARLLKKLDVDSVPINLLVPVKGTALESLPPISRKDAIRTISIFRIILKDKIIKIAAGREAILKNSQAMGFTAGANGMLIGGYLTIKGRALEDDYKLIEEIKRLWKE
ncbi:MAG: biotin synthase BioB [Candidatus Omnitrophota bacterium]|nr:MAG: biotin synthase BioB [Candidatus Omnitrophota bacterium]